jgi:formate-nitrite transporter family protein
VLNLVGGAALAVILTSHGVLRRGTDAELIRVADHLVGYSGLTSFLSAVVAGGLMTLMTWFVEGAAESLGIRIVMAWIVGAVIALGAFNHAIVSTIEIVFGMRYGSDASVGQLFGNLGISVGGNLAGGLALVTFARFAQAAAGTRG